MANQKVRDRGGAAVLLRAPVVDTLDRVAAVHDLRHRDGLRVGQPHRARTVEVLAEVADTSEGRALVARYLAESEAAEADRPATS